MKWVNLRKIKSWCMGSDCDAELCVVPYFRQFHIHRSFDKGLNKTVYSVNRIFFYFRLCNLYIASQYGGVGPSFFFNNFNMVWSELWYSTFKNLKSFWRFRLSVCNNSRTAKQISIKSDIGEFYYSLSAHSSFVWNRTTITGTLHENVRAYSLPGKLSGHSQRSNSDKSAGIVTLCVHILICLIFFLIN
jgi:hypothetical protein